MILALEMSQQTKTKTNSKSAIFGWHFWKACTIRVVAIKAAMSTGEQSKEGGFGHAVQYSTAKAVSMSWVSSQHCTHCAALAPSYALTSSAQGA